VEPNIFLSLLETAQQDERVGKALFAALYSELHHLAKRHLARNGGPMSLGTTTLLHKAYIDIAGRSGPSFPDRSRFMGYAARVMRGLVIDHARSRRAQKRGGQFEITLLPIDYGKDPVDDRQLATIGDALDELAKVDPSLAELVDLKFFCGFSFAEIAAMRGMSERTIQRSWEKARIYLYCSIRPDLPL
jgi:RNA polymerase sigma factor (TIGR02999 family)